MKEIMETLITEAVNEYLEIPDIVNLYRDYATIPSPTKATVFEDKNKNILIQSEWSVRDIDQSEMSRFTKLDLGTLNKENEYEFCSSGLPQDVSTEKLSACSSSRKYKAVLRKVLNKKGEENQFIEIWDGTTKTKTVNIQLLEMHGKIYDDGQFGCLEWASSEGHLLYVAEKKPPKKESFFKYKPISNDKDICSQKDEALKGEEYIYAEDWGESLVGRHHPVLCVMDTSCGHVSVLDNLPEDISPGQAVWAPDDKGVVCVGWEEEPRRLGLTYCSNRVSCVYYIDLETAECSIVGNKGCSCRSPRFSPDNSVLIYLERDAGGPHHRGSRLLKCDWKTKKVSVVLNTLKVPGENGFPGIYADVLPRCCWITPNSHIIYHTIWKSNQELVCTDIITGNIERMTNDVSIGCWTLLSVYNNIVVASASSLNLLPHLVFGLISNEDNKPYIKWMKTDKDNFIIPQIEWSTISLTPTEDNINPSYPGLEYEAILVKPIHYCEKAVPLIVWPHGGPHSAFTTGFQMYSLLFTKLNFAVLLVNFRGSLGFGEDNIDSLLGNVGSQDVKDVQHAVETVITEKGINKDKIILFGGSHGGFLVTHLSGQYPDFYKVCICRNPVIDISGKLEGTDIPDWGWVETGQGFLFNAKSVANPEILKVMWEKSPIKYVHQVKIPTLILLGKKDLRVPCTQGLKYYNLLKANKIPVRLYMYEDNHSLSKVEVESDAFVHIILWIKDYILNK